MKIIKNKKGVSQVVGFIISFLIVSTITIMAIATVSSITESRIVHASRVTAESLVNYITNSVIECSATIKACKNAKYTKTIEIPTTLYGKNYYIEYDDNDEKLYIKSTDGKIQVSSTIFNQDTYEPGSDAYVKIRVFTDSEKVYSSSGQITIRNSYLLAEEEKKFIFIGQ